MQVILCCIFGLVVGALARLIVPGREPGGWVVSMLLGCAGALLGGFIGRALGIYREGDTAGFVMSLVGAIVVVAIYHVATTGGRRRTA